MKYVILPVLLLAALASGQTWTIEPVDAYCTPKEVIVRREGARTHVAYIGAGNDIWIASWDTGWRFASLDTSMVRPSDDGAGHPSFHFSAGPGGRLLVSGLGSASGPLVIEEAGSGWAPVWTHEALQYYAPLARAAYGVDTTLAVVYCENGISTADVVVESRVDSSWQVDTAVHFNPGSPLSCQLTLYDADCSPATGPFFLIRYAFGLGAGQKPPWTYAVEKGYLSGDTWITEALGGGYNAYVFGYDVAAGATGSVNAAVYSAGNLRFDRDSIWPGQVTDASAQVDGEGREQIAFVTQDGVLRFAFRDSRWHFCEVTGVSTATCCDLAIDEYGQPLIAFEDGNGVSLARGVDVVGVEESLKPQASSYKLQATVIRTLPAGAAAFDATGRRVMDSKPGVYFVRDEGRGTKDEATGCVRKVILQR
jgi:hypothetical protein